MFDRGRFQPGTEVILRPRTGGRVDLPAENPRLFGQRAVVRELHGWGAIVEPDDGQGEYRAGWIEMEVLGEADDPDPALVHLNGYSKSGSAREMGYTGDECSRCQGMRVRWNGKCKLCDDCGDGIGECG